MPHALTTPNPFALLMHPESVLAAVERSERLGHLKSRICRPLDKPLIPHADADGETAGDEGDEETGAGLS